LNSIDNVESHSIMEEHPIVFHEVDEELLEVRVKGETIMGAQRDFIRNWVDQLVTLVID
jgi:hypothetical protein